jgi:hypothetical protein
MDLCVSAMNEQHVIKVLLRNLNGEYLAGREGHWRLTRDRSLAVVCDYLRDHVAEQLQRLQQTRGIVLAPEPVDLRDAWETCDRCGRSLAFEEAYFNGREFLCPECRVGMAD